ncbi:MAG: DUF937 domain-containing protein [Nocardioidaceae bacterium]
MTDLNELFSQLPMNQIAAQFGMDPDTARKAVESAGAAILSGLNANAQNATGADALTRALQQHNANLLTGGINLGALDLGDGQKILDHVFGANKDQVANQLGGAAQLGGLGGQNVGNLMAMLAPIIMSFLTKQMSAGQGSAAAPAGGGIQDVLGSILGGGSTGGLGLDDLLGGLFGKK